MPSGSGEAEVQVLGQSAIFHCQPGNDRLVVTDRQKVFEREKLRRPVCRLRLDGLAAAAASRLALIVVTGGSEIGRRAGGGHC